MATKDTSTIGDDEIIRRLAGRLALCKTASEAFDQAAQELPDDSSAAEWLRRQSNRNFEFTILLHEAILAIPASDVVDAAVQLRALYHVLKLDLDLPDNKALKQRRDLLVQAGLESIALALAASIPQADQDRVGVELAFDFGTRCHVTNVEDYRAAMLAKFGADAFLAARDRS